MESAVLGWVSQGLQHEVIAMASCCKKGGGQKGNNCHRQTCTGTTGITVLMRVSGVVAGADLRHCLPLVNQFFRSSPERHGKLPTLNQRISLRIHHNGKSTGLARHQIGWNSPQMPNALACCVPGFHRLPSVFKATQISSGLRRLFRLSFGLNSPETRLKGYSPLRHSRPITCVAYATPAPNEF